MNGLAIETPVRVAIIYFFLLLSFRVMGKRQFSQMSPFELMLLILIPEIVSQSLLRQDYSMTNAIIAVTTLLSLSYLTSLVRFFSQRFESLFEGSPTILVRGGKIDERALAAERVPPGEVAAEMRKSGLERIEQVKQATLESDGTITIIPAENEELTPKKEKPGQL